MTDNVHDIHSASTDDILFENTACIENNFIKKD